MDMTLSIQPLILTTFYSLMLKEAVTAIMLASLLWALIHWIPSVRQRIWAPASDVPTRSDDRTSPLREAVQARRVLRIAFACLWILDGLLQAQPEMTTQFIPAVVKPLILGLPGTLPSLFGPALYLWGLHPLLFDSLSAVLQIGIGLSFLIDSERRLGRFGLYVSFAWALIIWVFGEGLGGFFSNPSWLTGLPGSAALYAIAAVFLLMPDALWASRTVRRGLTAVLGLLWFMFAIIQAWPPSGFWHFGGLNNAILPMAQMAQPGWMSAPLDAIAHTLNHAPAVYNGVFVTILTLLGLFWLWRPRTRWLVLGTSLWLLATWWIGQDFGIVGGLGTDPNSALPLLILTLTGGRLLRIEPSPAPHAAIREWRRRALWLYGTILVTVVVAVLSLLFGQYVQIIARAPASGPIYHHNGEPGPGTATS